MDKANKHVSIIVFIPGSGIIDGIVSIHNAYYKANLEQPSNSSNSVQRCRGTSPPRVQSSARLVPLELAHTKRDIYRRLH